MSEQLKTLNQKLEDSESSTLNRVKEVQAEKVDLQGQLEQAKIRFAELESANMALREKLDGYADSGHLESRDNNQGDVDIAQQHARITFLEEEVQAYKTQLERAAEAYKLQLEQVPFEGKSSVAEDEDLSSEALRQKLAKAVAGFNKAKEMCQRLNEKVKSQREELGQLRSQLEGREEEEQRLQEILNAQEQEIEQLKKSYTTEAEDRDSDKSFFSATNGEQSFQSSGSTNKERDEQLEPGKAQDQQKQNSEEENESAQEIACMKKPETLVAQNEVSAAKVVPDRPRNHSGPSDF